MTNKKIEIDKSLGKWNATLIEYDSLPYFKTPENTIDFIKVDSFGELMKEIGMRNWIDKLNKNI